MLSNDELYHELVKGSTNLGEVDYPAFVEGRPQGVHNNPNGTYRLFRIGYSWGGPMSLVVPYKVQGMRRFGFLAGRSGSLVRLAIGLEDVGDLVDDLDQAFRVLNAP